jgi:hypothetical protein
LFVAEPAEQREQAPPLPRDRQELIVGRAVDLDDGRLTVPR